MIPIAEDGEDYSGDEDTFPTLPAGVIIVETNADEHESKTRQHAKLPATPKPKVKTEGRNRRGGRRPKSAGKSAAATAETVSETPPTPIIAVAAASPVVASSPAKEKQVKIIKAPSAESLLRLTQESVVLYGQLRTPPFELQKKTNLLQFLQRLCTEHWPGTLVYAPYLFLCF